jgi:DNA-binding transcriptional ArsR family regulator
MVRSATLELHSRAGTSVRTRADLSASGLADRLPVSRQAIAKHLAVLADAGLVEAFRAGREVRYRTLGSRLSETARALDAIGAAWERRLDAIRRIAEPSGPSGSPGSP